MPDPTKTTTLLRVDDHDRDSAGMLYVYPVVSRRAGGVSIGINLNVNNACNWRCVYCQVPELKRGGPPPVDLDRLGREFRSFWRQATDGDFMVRRVPADARRLVDVAFSGNGEPTSADEFTEAVELVAGELRRLDPSGEVIIRLITNGSLVDRDAVRRGIARISDQGGEVWFKVDTALSERMRMINGVRLQPLTVQRRLLRCASICRTWVQTCLFEIDGEAPSTADRAAYLGMLANCRAALAGVHLYGIAREPMQPGGHRLAALPAIWLEELARDVESLGLTVGVSP
jgi:wyosine [tRNA(Phe)-imidazoG37] synthetase (radical SAM superfamily)